MTTSALQNLQAAIKASAAGGAFALDAACLTAGLADPSVTVPPGYDADVRAAFGVAAAAFLITVAPGDVGPVVGDRFTVVRASLPFLGVALSGTGTLVFALTDSGSVLVVQIESAPPDWTWTTSFPAMTGWPFTALPVTNARFVFSTHDGTYPFGDPSGIAVTGGPRQNMSANTVVPAAARPLLALFDPPLSAPATVVLRGALDLSRYNATSILFPTGTLRGALSPDAFKLLYLDVVAPGLALGIPAPANPAGKTIADQSQTPQLSVAADLRLDGAPSAYTMLVGVPPPATPPTTGTTPFSIGLRAGTTGTQLTPATMVALAGGGSSYLTAVPPVLQQFMTAVSLRGLALAGTLGRPPKVSLIGVEIGSVPGMTWTPIPDPPPGLDFTFTSFALAWSLMNPFDSTLRQQTFVFSTQFTLAPAIFKGKTPGTDGLFTVSFTSDLWFGARFDGIASLRDFIDVLSDGAVTLPDGVEASLSDISVDVDYPGRAFQFVSGFDLAISFLEVGGKPILSISGGRVSLGAMTPTQGGGGANARTAWQSGIAGLLAVGPLGANVSVTYDGFQTPARWLLSASLAAPIEIEALIQQFFDPFGSYQFPSFLPGTVTIKTFSIAAQLGSAGGQPPTTYAIDTTFSWLFDLGDQQVGINPARLMIAYDGAKPAGQQFSGLAEGTWVYTAINFELTMGYKFVPTAQGPNNILYVEWEGFRAEYETGKEELRFSLRGWTVGTLLQALVRTLGDPYFTLPSPWDLLNAIPLDGLSLIVSLKSNVANRVSAAYALSKPINLGFIVIKGLIFRRDVDGKVTLAIDGTVPPPLQGQFGDLLDPAKGQDVQDMPTVPGQGEAYFKLFLLALGQRIGITGHDGFRSTQEVIRALEGVPNTISKQNPVNPTANKGTKDGLPYYNQDNNWLIAGHLGLLQVAGVWTVDAMVVFDDPDLYGLRLALAGPRAGGLAGLAVDILYKKISDDVGVFQLDFTFPDSIRNLNFGTFSIVLPQIGIKVYTNGDFFLDIGFPYNLDFRRSFSISAIVYGVPVLGSGGFYFGKLSSATATQVPRTTQGTFDPVIVFGLGLQLGLGYNFVKGPLAAGFALTVFGIVEGVIAPWHPYTPALPAAAGTSLQDEYYFKLSGTVGIIGLLYGKVDFAIIQASVNVKITLSLKITYESFRAIPIVATARVEVSLKVKIDLGLFSISISLSFALTVSARFVLGSDQVAPWDDAKLVAAAHRRNAALLTGGPSWEAGPPGSMTRGGPAAVRARAKALEPRPRRHARRAADKPRLGLVAAPQYTVLAPEAAVDPATQQGAFVYLMAMDAPAADSGKPDPGTTSFGALCAAYFPWVIDALGGKPGGVSRAELEVFVARLADNDAPAFTTADLLGFIGDNFTLDIATTPAGAQKTRDAMAAGATLFPVFDGLSLSVPDPAGGKEPKAIAFETYATATSGYRKVVADLFAEVEVRLSQDQASRSLAALDDPESMAALVFGDTFSIIGRQLLQAALGALETYVYMLGAHGTSDSIAAILGWANGLGNHLVVDDVALPNQDHALTAARTLSIAGLSATIQAKDTLDSVAARYSDPAEQLKDQRWITTPSSLVLANADARFLAPGVELLLQGKFGETTYITVAGDTFAAIARSPSLEITLDELAVQSTLHEAEGLLIPAQPMAIPPIAYTTADATPDTLRGVAAQFAVAVPALAATNQDVAGLFSTAAEDGVIALANLTTLPVADLWSAIQATDEVAQTAGMVSRFLMFGLRLPDEDGLGLSNSFLYPTDQKGYGLYQLTGQQFPVPGTIGTGSYGIEVARADASHGVSLDFVEFNGAPGKRAPIDLTSAYGLLDVVVTWARTGAFQPAPGFAALPLASTLPRRLGLPPAALWSTSDLAALQQLTDRGQGGGGALVQPTLWSLPSGLLSEIAARQAALAAVFPKLDDARPRMPRFAPQRSASSATGAVTTSAALTSYAWATRVDVQIKRLPALAVADAEPSGDGSVPAGPQLAKSLRNVYELVGPSSEAGRQLASLLNAMSQLGDGIASGVSLLYAQPGASNVELATLGDDEFLAFITQTNLSTEGNPEGTLAAAAAATAVDEPHGIANSPAELVRLLWELSVVRNGGYYLYYRVLDGDAGLPPSLFDESGSATLSLVVTFTAQGSASFGDNVLDFVNAFVTTDDIDLGRDVVELVSEPAATQTAPLAGTETLAAIAAVYGVGPGPLVTQNRGATVAAGRIIPIVGLIHQLRPADVVDPSQTLANLATYYSAGAETPITAAQIAAMNPGVPVELAAVFYIPRVDYVVNASAAPGAMFSSMAAYYGISLDAMAVLALDVGGLFAADTVLALDTQSFDLRSTLGPKNLGVALTRENLGEPTLPPNPTPAQKAAFARASMYTLYNTLSAGYQPSTYFTGSPLGLPFGPQSDGDGAAGTAHPMRAAAHRRARLAAAADADFRYPQLLGLGRFARINAAKDLPGLAPAADSPYVGVGTPAPIALQWQDLFGNTTVTPFTDASPGYTGAINGEAVRIRYADRLVGPAAWPGALLYYNYSYAGDSAAATLDLKFALDPAHYAGQRDQAERDLALYRLVYYQLDQDYTGKGVPGVTGNAVTMQVSNSLLADPQRVLSDAEAAVIRGFVAGCVAYLVAIVGGTTPPPPTATLHLPVATGAIASGTLVALDVALAFTRNPQLTDPEVAAQTGGLTVAGAVLPEPDGGDTIAYTRFAAALEVIFQVKDAWRLRVGEGQRAQAEAGSGARQLWAVRFGDGGIAFQIGKAASYYAPKPIARTLVNRSATILQYPSGTLVTSAFTGADQNLWFQAALDAVDAFLSAETSTSVFLLDQLLGTEHPLEDGYLGKVLAAKQSLADSISATVLPILSTSADDPSTQWAARTTLRQALLSRLGPAYTAGATVVFGLDGVTGGAGDLPPRLYGQPAVPSAGASGAGAANQNYTLSSARLPLGKTTVAQGETYDPRLAFQMTTKNVVEQAYVPLDLGYAISHLEFDRTAVPGIAGYVQSNWLAFVTGPIDAALGDGTSNIPVVNRALPVPPTMTQQTGDKLSEHPATAGELPLWSYRFEYQSAQAAQDAVQILIELNASTGATAKALTTGPDLFTALAQFVSTYPAVSVDLATTLPQIGAGSTDQATVALAQQAVRAFQEQITAIAAAHAATVTPAAKAARAGAPELVQVTMTTRLDRGGDDEAVTEILDLRINGVPATWDPEAGTMSNGTIVLPAVVVEIAPELYTAEPISPPPPNVVIAYRYRAADGTYLAFDDALQIPARAVMLRGLNVLAHQNAWSSLEVQRNRILTPIADAGRIRTNDAFVFQTPTVRFADPIVPRLAYAAFSLDGLAPPDASLAAHLDAFYAALFAGGDGSIATAVTMTAAYSYQLIPGVPRTLLPIAMAPPEDAVVDPKTPPAFIDPFAALVDAYVAKIPTLQGEPQENFTVTLFAATGPRQPILVIQDLSRTVTRR